MMMPLTMAPVGQASKIQRVGAEVTVISAIGGNVIVNIKDSRVAINQDMARHIMVA